MEKIDKLYSTFRQQVREKVSNKLENQVKASNKG